MHKIFLTMNKKIKVNRDGSRWFSIRDGLVAVYLVYTKPSSPIIESTPLMISSRTILSSSSSNADKLKAAVNHKLLLLMPGPCYSWVLVKTANPSLEIAILAQIGVLIWSLDMKRPSRSASIKSCSKLYPIVVMCLCLCKMHVCMVLYNYALSSWTTKQKVWP